MSLPRFVPLPGVFSPGCDVETQPTRVRGDFSGPQARGTTTPFREPRREIRLGDSADRMPKMPARIGNHVYAHGLRYTPDLAGVGFDE
ncbi:MAG: hypothetical protein ACRDG4_16310 [Chloroflexota bacterium]